MRTPTRAVMPEPHTPGELYDLLQRWFGLGNWDEIATPEVPHYTARARQIGHLKRVLRERNVDVEQVAKAAFYAHTHGLPIRWISDLCRLIPEATIYYRDQERLAAAEDRRAGIYLAAAVAMDAGHHDWANRILAAHSTEAPNVVAMYRKEHPA